MGTQQHCNSPWLLLSNSKIMANHYSDDTSLLSHQPLLLKQAGGRKVLSVLLCHKCFILFPLKSHSLGGLLGSGGQRWGHTHTPFSPCWAPPAPQWAALPHGLGALQAQWTGDIHTVNDSSTSGTTERIENGCKDDYYNFQHLSPKS